MPPCRRTPSPLPHLDSCLFSPPLSTDLIEGNHSDKKPPTMMPPHSGLCALPPSNPTTSPPLQLSPPPLKCHAVLSTHPELPRPSSPHRTTSSHHLQHRRRHNEPFVWQRGEVTVAVVGERAGPAAPAVDWSSRTPGSTSLIVKRARALPKTLHFSLLSPCPSSLRHPPPPTTMTRALLSSRSRVLIQFLAWHISLPVVTLKH